MLDLSLPTIALSSDIKVEGRILSTTQQKKLHSQASITRSLRKQIAQAHQEADLIRAEAKAQAQQIIEDEKRQALLEFMAQLDLIFEEIETERSKQWQLMQTTTSTMLEQALLLLTLKIPLETQLQAVIDMLETHTKQTPILNVLCHSSALDWVTACLMEKPFYSATRVQRDDTLDTDSIVFESRSGRYRASWKEAISTLSAAIRTPTD
ncbi:hypothetical protein THF1D04_360003 [Vibrio owensii]|uniref:Flagellar assembly protein FliH/Type III secretion system HrpE domain-containing protein n=1 Tax=Vibrio owensii TaxID=696485 RepID=A0AAU9Q8U1_9VIBR|nr:hypothetical protein THF1D04_360003 [Vibrio owensii]